MTSYPERTGNPVAITDWRVETVGWCIMSSMSSSPGDASFNHSPGQHSVTDTVAASAPSSDVVVVSGPGSEEEEASGGVTESPTGEAVSETVAEPGKVMRIGSMIKQLLEEVRQAPLDERSRVRLREIYQTSVKELSTALSPDLRTELQSLALPFDEQAIPSEAELRVAQAQLVGWLEGLFHGIQATLFAQQMAAQAQLQQMRQIGPGGQVPESSDGGGAPARPGTYL